MTTSKLDAMYRSILITKFFTKGWGKPENLRRLFEFRKVVSNRDECFKLIERDYPVTITREQNLTDCRLLEGYFTSPLERYLPGIVPEVAQKAHFQVMMPLHWPEPGLKPMCLHLAGTGDHFFWRRRNLMVKPLLKEAGIGGIILENPFYGLRKPIDQIRSSLHNVSDIFVMGGCLILESLVLFHWCERNGLGPLGVTGLSMGGHMASLAATNWPKPLVLVPCLSWSTASAVFLQGVMAHSINWDLLEDQYLSDGEYREKLSKMVTIVDEAFLAGKKFAQSCSENIDTVLSTNKMKQQATEKTESIDVQNKILKNVDITYKENFVETNTKNQKSDPIDVTKTVLDSSKATQKAAKQQDSITQLKTLNEELKRLLEEGKISWSLYSKLTSNEKFVLEAEDIDDINKMTEEHIKEVLLKCKVAEIRQAIKQTQSIQNEPLHDVTDTQTSTFTSKQNGNIILEADNLNQPNSSEENTDMNQTMSDQSSIIQSLDNKNTNQNFKEIIKNNHDLEKVVKTEKKSWSVSELTSDLWTNLPFRRPRTERKINIGKINWRDREALQFMRGIMDECTHLSNFSVPFDTSLIIAVCAKHDAYVPRDDVGTLEEIWPGAEVRYVDAGHVSAYILHQSLFRACVKEAFERSKKRWKDGKHVD